MAGAWLGYEGWRVLLSESAAVYDWEVEPEAVRASGEVVERIVKWMRH